MSATDEMVNDDRGDAVVSSRSGESLATDNEAPTPLGPDSLTWKIFMSLYFQPTALYLGVMQNMHPGLGAGVEFHSTINDEFWQRVLRSLYPIAGVVFDGDQAESTAKDVVGYHKTIKGTDSQGRRYNALDPGTFYWAHATFFMATVLSGDLLMGGLTERQKEQLWSTIIGIGCTG